MEFTSSGLFQNCGGKWYWTMQGSNYVERAPFRVTLEFEDAGEARELAKELSGWTPLSGGWSETAQELFRLLRNEKE